MSHSSETAPVLSFQDAIAATQTLMAKMANNQLSEAEIEQAIASIVSSKSGARGFFVPYLTSDMNLADNPSSGVVKALKTAPEVVSDLLVKNLAMSAAMAITHRRNHDESNAQGSERVTKRTANLIQLVDLDLVTAGLNQLKATIAQEEGEYQEFLNRWGYDHEQQAVIQQAISQVI